MEEQRVGREGWLITSTPLDLIYGVVSSIEQPMFSFLYARVGAHCWHMSTMTVYIKSTLHSTGWMGSFNIKRRRGMVIFYIFLFNSEKKHKGEIVS